MWPKADTCHPTGSFADNVVCIHQSNCGCGYVLVASWIEIMGSGALLKADMEPQNGSTRQGQEGLCGVPCSFGEVVV